MDIRQINRVRKSVNSCWVLIKIGLPYAAIGQFCQHKLMQETLKKLLLAHGYSSESTQLQLSNVM